MKRRILDATAAAAAATSNTATNMATNSSSSISNAEPVSKRPRYDDYATFTDAPFLCSLPSTLNTELFAKLKQQKAELARLSDELARSDSLARAWQHAAQDFHVVVQSHLPGLVSSSSSSSVTAPRDDSVFESLWSAEPSNEITRATTALTSDSRELLALIVDSLRSHIRPSPSDELTQLRTALSSATTRALGLEHELHSARRSHVDEALSSARASEAEERLEREMRHTHRLQLQLAQQQEQHERALREALRNTTATTTSTTTTANATSEGDSETQTRVAEHQGVQDVLALRQATIEQLRSEKSAALRTLETERAEWSANASAVWDARVRSSALYRAAEERVAYYDAVANSARAQLEEARTELSAQHTQRRHDSEQRNRLQQSQLVTQEEKIQAVEARLKKVQAERDVLAHELELRKNDKPAAQLLRQLSEELATQTRRAQEAQEQKAAFLERISDLKRTLARLERGPGSSSSIETSEIQQRLEAQERENETLLSEMGNMEAELTRVQQDNTRLLRQLAEGEEARLHHTLERASWTKVQQSVAKKAEVEREKLLKADERLKAQEAVLQQQLAKIASLEQQLRAKTEEATLLVQRSEAVDKTQAEVVLLAHDLEQRCEELQGTLLQAQQRAAGDVEARDELQREVQQLREELAMTLRKAQATGGKLKGSSGSDSWIDQQLESYKRIVRCSVCNDRTKNTVITRCYHCFCKECIEDNLEKRIRKCPGCGVSFGEKDVHALWF